MTNCTRTYSLVMPIVAAALAASAARTIADPPVNTTTSPAAPTAQVEATSKTTIPKEAKRDSGKKKTYPIPDWVYDSSWYRINVSFFRNGDPSNDPSDTQPWSFKRHAMRAIGGEIEHDGRSIAYPMTAPPEFGGDLEGLRSKLQYLNRLGVNTLYIRLRGGLSSDYHHGNDSFGVSGDARRLAGETKDPATWSFTPSDRLFLRFVEEAHELGLRVVADAGVVHAPATSCSVDNFESRVDCYSRIVQRLLDPNRDGDPSDGVDGFVLGDGAHRPIARKRTLRDIIKAINPEAILVSRHSAVLDDHVDSNYVDALWTDRVGLHITEFFKGDDVAQPLSAFIVRLDEARNRHAENVSLPLLVSVSGLSSSRRTSRVLHRIWEIPGRSPGDSVDDRQQKLVPSQKAYDAARLAITFQHLYFGIPLTLFGDEVGMFYSEAPMWWSDLPDPKTKSPHYRGDFLALVRMLNALRVQFAPLRRGDVRTVLLDDGRKVMAFARTLPGDEVIVAMNFGNKQQQVALPTGKPGQLVKVVNPQLKPEAVQLPGRPKPPPIDFTKVPRLRVGGSRVMANDRGEVLLWLAPMSVRLVLLSDN